MIIHDVCQNIQKQLAKVSRDTTIDQHREQLEANSNHQERIASKVHACKKKL